MTLSTTYGLTASGFVPKTQAQIIKEIRASLQGAFGENINISDKSPFGQFLNIYSEREAYVWQLAEAVYASQYPIGAEGTSVDNILSLNFLSRIKASPTKTADVNSAGLPGLVLYGSLGTTIAAGSIISVEGNPSIQFTLDSSVTIGAAQKCVQYLAFAGGPPTIGTWQLQLVDANGVAMTTGTLNWNDTNTTVQTKIRALTPDLGVTLPYTDVTVTGSWAAGGFTVTFGGTTPTIGQPASGDVFQNLFTITNASSLINVTTQVNGYVYYTKTGEIENQGHPAQAFAAASCTKTGPTYVGANTLNVIGSPVSGWTSVTNPVDCVTGSNIESDIEAVVRRANLLSADSGGTLTSIIDRVKALEGIVNAVGFENTSAASWQLISFTGAVGSGHYHLTFNPSVGGAVTTGAIQWDAQDTVQRLRFSAAPTGGSFTLTMGGHTTAAIPYTATALDVQTALRTALVGTAYGLVSVTGSFTAQAFYVGHGNGYQTPITAGGAGLTNGGAVTVTVTPSIQSLINAESTLKGVTVNGLVATGLQIKFGGDSGDIGQGLITIDHSALAGGVTEVLSANNLDPKAFQIVIDYTKTAVLDAEIVRVILTAKPAGIKAYGSTVLPVLDSAGNEYEIGFTEAAKVNFYVTLTLTTDLLTAEKPQFSPGSIPAIQAALADIGNAVGIGGIVVGYGTSGLVGAFNAIPGIMGYTIAFGRTATPTTSVNVQMLSTEVPLFELHDILVSYV